MFTPEQKEGLEKRYKRESHPDALCQEQIAEELGLTRSNVQVCSKPCLLLLLLLLLLF